ncbi:hypothetical protein FO519_003685 [Halicephalobus sp. NKZ332]|nr:hypothetical protein FO519_003685 [Halicephalobus sp. NKZ332]
MAYENINVRMTRTGKSITWGFSLRQNGPSITVAFVEKDSMAEKAGIQVGDSVEQIFGTKPGNLKDVQNRIQNSDELSLVLKRFIANPPGLPWTLEDSGNQVIVNRFDDRGRLANTYDKNTAGYQNSFHTTQSYGPPALQETHKTTNYKKTETHEGGLAPFGNEQLPFSNTISSESHSNWDHEDGNIKKHYESNRTYTRTESTNVGSGGGFQTSGAPFGGQNNYNSNFSGNNGASFGENRQVKTYSNGNSAPWTSQKTSTWGTGGAGQIGNAAHWMRNEGHHQGPGAQEYHGVGGQRSPGYPGSGGQRSSSLQRQPVSEHSHFSNGPGLHRSTKSVTPIHQYDGPRMYYQRTPRTARELSPRATIQHLQYNSPLGMYSPEAASEAYKMQTGQDLAIDGDYPTGNRPAYLDSATRRLIAEEEQGGMRYRSPTPQQSSSFKRISYAVGTPVN